MLRLATGATIAKSGCCATPRRQVLRHLEEMLDTLRKPLATVRFPRQPQLKRIGAPPHCSDIGPRSPSSEP